MEVSPMNQPVEIPEHNRFTFDAEESTEKPRPIFCASDVLELETVKRFANPKDRGLIKDAGLHTPIQEFLRADADAKATIEKDEELTQTSIGITGSVLVHAIKLEHH